MGAVNPNEVVDIVVRFAVFCGRYMYHCHVLEHEDHDTRASRSEANRLVERASTRGRQFGSDTPIAARHRNRTGFSGRSVLVAQSRDLLLSGVDPLPRPS
jgi:Multicopper oxidase